MNSSLQEMVHSACKGLDHAFHLQRKEEGGEARDVDVGLDGNQADLQVVVLGEDVDDALLFG